MPYAKLGNPQSLNLYAYMLNNPLKGADPDGHDGDVCKKEGADCSGTVQATKNKDNGSVTARIGTTESKKEYDDKGSLKSGRTTSTITTQTTDYNGKTTTTQDQSVTKQTVDAKGNLGSEKDVSGYAGKTISQFDSAAKDLTPFTVGLQHQTLGGFVEKVMGAVGLNGGSLAGSAADAAAGATVHNMWSTGDKDLDDALRE